MSKYEKFSKEELIDELETLKKKKYGLVWDKKNSQEMLDAFVNWENVPENFTPKQFPVLKEVKNKEIENDTNKPVNLLIEGDNYHSLAVLNFTHQEKIDVIYIDPPYNTGNKDFIYNDKFIDKEDPFRHSKWLSFMEKRLNLAKKLLKKTGVIFISIDDNEQAQLKLLCDEIFGEENFQVNIIWKSKGSGAYDTKGIKTEHEYLLVYSKGSKAQFNSALFDVENDKQYVHKDERFEIGGKYKRQAMAMGTLTYSKSLDYPLKNPDGVFQHPGGQKDGRYIWRWRKEKVDNALENGFVEWVKTKKGWSLYSKQYQYLDYDGNKLERKIQATSIIDDILSRHGTQDLQEIFSKKIFDYPKPVRLIKKILEIAGNNNSIVLDFMAGSGTTGKAVLELNNEDGGNRKFILCTNDEEIDNNGSQIKHKICTDVCYPRVEKVINGYKNSKGEKVVGLGGNLKYFKTDFVNSGSTDKNRRDLVNKSAEMICIKEDIFDIVVDKELDFKIYQKDKKFLGVIFDIDAIKDFKKEAEKHKGNFVVYCFSYTEDTPEKEFKGLKNKYVLKPVPAMILKIYSEIFKK